MKRILIIGLFLAGCNSQSHPVVSVSKPVANTKELQEKWLHSYTALANKSTVRTYECISEMYSLVYSHVASGPVCKASCALWDELDDMVANAPAYIENPEQYKSKEATYCKKKSKKQRASLR
jgi:hypothetical protein